MDCCYPCHICDPEDWEEERNRPPSWEEIESDITLAFQGQMNNLDRVEKSLKKPSKKPNVPLWWIPMDYMECLYGVKVSQEIDTEDIGFSYRPIRTMITAERTYLEKDGYPPYPIRSIYYRVIDDMSVPTHVLTCDPPPWGHWLPTLEEF